MNAKIPVKFENIVPIRSSKHRSDVRSVVLETRVVTGTGGGPEKTIINTPRYMNPFGYPTLCAYMHPPKDPGFSVLEARALKQECSLIGVDDRGMLDWSVVSRLLEICVQNDVGIWHGHDYKSNLFGLLLRRKHPMKLITTVHGWVRHTWKTPLYYALDRWCLKHYDHVICVSHDLRDRCLKLGVRPERCSLVENAIDTKQYSRRISVEAAKKQFQFPTDRLIVGACGRLSPEKNFAGLIQAVSELIHEGLPLSLYIAGEGSIQSTLQKQIDASGNADFIRLIGFRDNIQEFYQGLDLFVLNSLREGLPNVVLEAMSYEVPVLSTRVAGVPNLITNGYNGVLIDIRDAAALKVNLRLLAEKPDYRRMIAENGNLTVIHQFNFGLRMKKIRAIYDKILDS